MARGSFSTAAATQGAPSPPPYPPVFVDTSLDTHLAMIVSPEDTVADLKRKVGVEHVVCFPNIGDITVLSMKVRRRATYYHLSDSMLVRTAFDGIKGTWFLHLDVVPINSDGNISGSCANKTKCGVTDGPSSVHDQIKAGSNLKLTDPSLPDGSLMPCMAGKSQSSTLELPSSDLLLITETNGEASKKKSGTTKSSSKSEKSAPKLGNRSDVIDPESNETFIEANRVLSSHVQLATDISTDELNKYVKGKDCANVIDKANDGDASTVAAGKEKSRKRIIKSENDHLLEHSSETKKHKKEEGRENAGSWEDYDKDFLEFPGTEDVLPEDISGDHIIGNLGMLGEEASQPLKDYSAMLQELPGNKEKRKKRRRKESNECHNETDASISLNASDSFKNSTVGTGLSECASKENGLVLGKEAIEDMQEKELTINDNCLGASSGMKLLDERNAKDLNNVNHIEVDSEVAAKDNKRSARQTKKKVTKGELHSSESKSKIVHPSGKQMNGEHPEEVPKDDPKCLATEPNVEIDPKEASGTGNDVEILLEGSPDDGRSTGHIKKRSDKAGSSKVKSGKAETFSSATNLPEKTTIVAGNLLEADSTASRAKKSSNRSKKKSVQTKESYAEAPREEDPPIAGPATFAERSGDGNERTSSSEAFMPKTTQQEDANNEEAHITKESHKIKVQEGDTVNSDLSGPKDLATKQHHKSRKKKTAIEPQVKKSKEGRGKSCMPHGDTSPHVQSLKSSQEHQISENHDQEFFTGNELKKPTHHTEVKRSADYQGTGAHIGQHKTEGYRDDCMKEVNVNPAASSESTEEDTLFNEKHYRVAVRKIPKSRSKKNFNKSKQEEIFLNATDKVFGHFTSTNSEDEVEGNISDNSMSDDSEEDLERMQLVRGPRMQTSTNFQGSSPSSAYLLGKETTSDDILLSQTSNASKKRIALGTLLRSSHSYMKAKLTAQSQTDDTESQPIDAVPETQPDYP
uniref:Uncharacterized protein n=1 Tax=Anthurium amnicola TaxID=1678845 RepID=A0A1D1XY53_9ARAE